MSADPDAVRAVAALAGRSVATAESLTAGLVVAALGSVAGVSAVLRGGVVAYTPAAKRDILGVDATLLERGGTVQAEVAEQMARGACRLFGARFGVATTGVAGPGSAEGRDAGTVYVCVRDDDTGEAFTRFEQFAGDRDEVRRSTAALALRVLARVAEQNPPEGRLTD